MWAWFASWWFLDGARRREQFPPAEVPDDRSWWALVGMYWPFLLAFAFFFPIPAAVALSVLLVIWLLSKFVRS